MSKSNLDRNLKRLIGLPNVSVLTYFDKIPSTNEYAMELISNGEDCSETLIIANSQQGGRGRLGKEWISPEGGIYFSLILTDEFPPWLSLISALAVSDAINLHRYIKTGIKWPNDVLVENKKVAGILVQVSNNMTIIGVGINTFGEDLLPSPDAVTLGGLSLNEKYDIIERTLMNLDDLIEETQESGIPKRKLLSKMAFFNDYVSILNNDKKTFGRFVDIADNGAIVIENDGFANQFISGSIVMGKS